MPEQLITGAHSFTVMRGKKEQKMIKNMGLDMICETLRGDAK